MNRLVYEKPTLILISTVINGASCNDGVLAAAACSVGSVAHGGSCNTGSNAQGKCSGGAFPHDNCTQGSGE